MEGGGSFYLHPDELLLLPDKPPPTRPSVAEVRAAHPEALWVSLVFFPTITPGCGGSAEDQGSSDNVPADLKEPFYTDQYDQEHIKPPVVNLLLSAELYCRAGSLILKSDAAKPLLGHDAVIQALAQRGLYVTDQEKLVTERDLRKKPIQMNAHLAMIDTLMMAYTVEMVSVEKVVKCVQQYSTFYPDTDMPYDTEDAIICWINKVNEHLKEIILHEQKIRECQSSDTPAGPRKIPKYNDPYFSCVKKSGYGYGSSSFQARYRKEQTMPRQMPCIPPVENLLKDSTDGCALAALIHFYCPDLVKLEEQLLSVYGRVVLVVRSCEAIFCSASGCRNRWSSVHGVSFDIPFDKENTVQSTAAPTRGMTRSISNEGLGFKVNPIPRNIKRNLLFQPVNGQNETEGIEEEIYLPETSGRCAGKSSQVRLANGPVLDDYGNHVGTPSIEEALQIIHDSEKMQGVIQTEKVNNGFFLHSQEIGVNNLKLKREEVLNDSNEEAKGSLSPDTTEVDTGIHVRTEDIQETMDEDSSLKDYTVSMDSDMDHDYELKVGHTREIISPCPSSVSIKSQAGSTTSSGSGVKMTSFAEQKFKKLNNVDGRSSGSSSQKTTPESSELNIPHMVSWAQTPDESPVKQGKDPTQLLASEMVQLRMKLEEKRRAIEAQKKKVEAAFTQHRQRMGRTAFLTVVKKKGDGTSPLREEAAGSEDEKLSSDDHISKSPEDNRMKPGKCKNDILDNLDSPQGRWLKSPNEEAIVESDLLEYTKSIEKLNSSLFFLQQEMQRLAQQQEVIMQMREQQAWVISPPQPSPQKQVRELRTSSRSTGSMSPVLSSGESPRTSHRSPQTITRKSASFNSKTPRTPRPSDLKLTPFNRILTPPQSVDSLPRLRRFSPSQTQTRSFVCLGDDHSIQKDLDSADHTSAEEDKTIASVKERVLEVLPVVEKAIDNKEKTKEVGGLQVEEKDDNKGKLLESSVSEILSQTVTETVIVTPNADSSVEFNDDTSKNSSLIEVPLSVLKPLDGEILEEANDGEAGMDNYDEEQKMCCGFFFKDDQKGEDDMAMKRAALLEKRLRREKENQERKQQLEAELEQKKEEARIKAEEDRQKKEDEKARREFIKQEYLRRKQLKLMEDMDTVIKPRPASCKQKKPRPKSVHRDIMESPKTPVRAPAGSRPRVFSVSSLSLASLNLGDNDSIQSGRRTPRPESADGFLSPCRSASRNGEKDWENGSTTSSVASNTEYTGPKLYKEPSAKSNKHIIQNALAHCCLAGKVNEGQKNKILEEMEKSEANNFLILFRDSGCQFRSLYTYCPEMEEINKLAGIGPKSITFKMIEGLYKYNSDRKQFSHIPAKTMSASVDAITIHSHLWQTKRPVTPKKILPSKS
ncbi:CAMP2 protein, partial [Polypterus senegalus]